MTGPARCSYSTEIHPTVKMGAAQLLYGDDVAGAIVPDMDDNLVVQLIDAIKSGEAEGLAQAESLFGSDDRTSASLSGRTSR